MQEPTTISIRIALSPNGAPVIETHTTGGRETTGASDMLESMPSLPGELEAVRRSKAQDEQDMDYSDCPGFDPKFMGIHTPIPEPGAQLKRKLALPKGARTNFVLRYYHYSIMHHSIRRMPVVSAVNVDGDPAERKDKTPRKDEWLRDNRIDQDIQLNDAFYRSSGFDKGHMSRREDANWDDKPKDAERDANLTCMYTNAVPQVPEINRSSSHGLWGQLEKIILEKGVKKEEGDTTKICVYNGPIFVDTDPVYKSVQVPLRFYKIVVWKNDAGEPKTTAFILSQEDLVGGIQFEELQFDQEFKEHQCSIPLIEKLTGLTFTTIRDWDTFEGGAGGVAESAGGGPGGLPVTRIDRQQLEELVARNNH
jgi:endonuclease G, mitochondrial